MCEPIAERANARRIPVEIRDTAFSIVMPLGVGPNALAGRCGAGRLGRRV